MRVRDIDGADGPQLQKIVADLWVADELWRPGRVAAYAVDQACVIGVERGGRLVGVAGLQTARFPRFGVIQLDVVAEAQRVGVGTQLLAGLRSRYPEHRMMMRVRPWDEATVAFCETNGFEVAERVVEGWLDPMGAAVSEWIDRTLATSTAYASVESGWASEWPRETIALLLEDWFQRHHGWLSRPDLTAVEAVERYLDPALENTLFVASVANEAVGAGVLVPDPFGQRNRGAHLAYLGVGGPGRSDEAEIVAGLVAHCLASARGQDRPVQVEVQHHHHALHRVIASLPTDSLYDGLVVYVTP
jgi:GNAT superfamily N-acetyltransferase